MSKFSCCVGPQCLLSRVAILRQCDWLENDGNCERSSESKCRYFTRNSMTYKTIDVRQTLGSGVLGTSGGELDKARRLLRE